MGNLAAVKLLLLFSPQKHSGSLSHSSLASQIVKKKKKHCTNIIWQQDQKPSRKVKLLTYLMDRVQSIGMKKKKLLFKMHYSDYFQKELLRTFFFALLTDVQSVKTSVVKRWLLFPSKQFRFGAMSLFWDLFELPHAHESQRHWEQQHNP